MRKYRLDQKTRNKYAEVFVDCKDLIQPYFIVEGNNIKKEIESLKNVYHFSTDKLLEELKELIGLKINKILLFGVIDDSKKDSLGSNGYDENNLVSQTVKKIKLKFPDLTIITDVCLCGYTSHGHCGIVKDNEILNDETLPLLAKMALTHADAGADFVAPSSMMDYQVKAIRTMLDNNKFKKTKILSYSTKYASNFYGPFRDAFNSAPKFGDRKTYQCDYRTIDQGIKEAENDINEGADWIMVKPALCYLDMINRIKQKFPNVPLAAYHVSGEYMSLKLLSSHGLINEKEGIIEVLTAIKRAGADYIITYYAKDFAKNQDKK